MTAPIDLNQLRAFALVHETGGFSIAAERLRVPRSTVSRAVAQLERATGLLLFHRTTRRVTATPAGRALFERVRPSLATLEHSLSDLPEAQRAPAGTLRVTASADLGATVLAEAVARYTTRYPETRVEVQLTGTVVDLVKDGFDVALRFARGALRDSSLVARRIGTIAFRWYASPAYLLRRGTPRALAELSEHDIVAIAGDDHQLPRAPRITADDKFFVRAALRAGAGVGLLPSYLGEDDVATGQLARILPGVEKVAGTVHIVLPSKRHVPSTVTAFRDLLIQMLEQRPLRS